MSSKKLKCNTTPITSFTSLPDDVVASCIVPLLPIYSKCALVQSSKKFSPLVRRTFSRDDSDEIQSTRYHVIDRRNQASKELESWNPYSYQEVSQEVLRANLEQFNLTLAVFYESLHTEVSSTSYQPQYWLSQI